MKLSLSHFCAHIGTGSGNATTAHNSNGTTLKEEKARKGSKNYYCDSENHSHVVAGRLQENQKPRGEKGRKRKTKHDEEEEER